MAKDKTVTAEPDTDTVKTKKAKKDKPAKATSSGADIGISGPGTGGTFVAADQVDELLLITPISLEEDVVTTNGTSDAIKADIVVLNKNKPGKSVEIAGGLVFQKVLQGQLQDALRNRTRVCGTLIVDHASKKAGQTAPYRLTAPSDADIEVAKAYLDSLNPLR